VDRLAATVSVEPGVLRRRLATVLAATSPDDLALLLREHEGELVWLAMTDPSFAAALAAPVSGADVADLAEGDVDGGGVDAGRGDGATAPQAAAVAGVSGDLARRLRP
jgi:hypothetical protein